MECEDRALRRAEGLALRAQSERFSRVGWALFAYVVSSLLVQVAAVAAAMLLRPELLNELWFLWVMSAVSSYAVGFVLFALIIRRAPKAEPLPRRPAGPLRLGQYYLVSMAALYVGNIISLLLNGLIGLIKGSPVENPVDTLLDFPVALNLILVCVLAPLFEELMFRRLLLDRLRPYGERFALIGSALMFALIHGNLSQMFYAFGIGLVLGWLVLKTGCLWQSILIHAGINFISAGLLPLLEPLGEAGNVILAAFALGGTVLGIVFFFAYRRDVRPARGACGFSEGRKWRLLFENPGMVLFCLVVIYEVVVVIAAA